MKYEDFLYTLSNIGRFLSDEQISIENTIVYRGISGMDGINSGKVLFEGNNICEMKEGSFIK